jgi:hypothetical protein
MFLEYRLVAKVWNGMKVEIDDTAIADTKSQDLADESFLETCKMIAIKRVRIGGERSAFWQSVKSCKKSQARIKGMFPHMNITFSAEEFECKEGHYVTQGRDAFAPRKTCRPDYLVKAELSHEWGKQEYSGPGGLQSLAIKLRDFNRVGSFRKGCALDGAADFELSSAWKFREPFLGQNTLNGSRGNIQGFLAEQL